MWGSNYSIKICALMLRTVHQRNYVSSRSRKMPPWPWESTNLINTLYLDILMIKLGLINFVQRKPKSSQRWRPPTAMDMKFVMDLYLFLPDRSRDWMCGSCPISSTSQPRCNLFWSVDSRLQWTRTAVSSFGCNSQLYRKGNRTAHCLAKSARTMGNFFGCTASQL